jgi:N-hydroxyarylamine O-acetyltransferase
MDTLLAAVGRRSGLDRELVETYLRRLGCPVDHDWPSVDALFALHRSHAERVAYETFWIHLGERVSIDAESSVRRVAGGLRGGYCFHLNGALASVLGSLGYAVSLHVGGVHGAAGLVPSDMGNHVALIVSSQPCASNPDGVWYLDVGLGDGLYEPIPLVQGEYVQAGMSFGLDRTSSGDWHLRHDPDGSFAGVTIVATPTEIDVFSNRHEFNATSPHSPFAKTVTAQLRTASGVNIVRGKVVSRRASSLSSSETIETFADWVQLLGDDFGVKLNSRDHGVVGLWDRVSRAHDQWGAAQSVAVGDERGGL